MTNKNKLYIDAAQHSGLAAKEAVVYTTLLEAGVAISPKTIVARTHLHRQYVYDGLESLLLQRLVVRVGEGRRVKYQAASPDRLLQVAERRRIEALQGVTELMRLYDRSPAGVVEVVRGAATVIASEFAEIEAARKGDYVDIIGGAGMHFVELFGERVAAWEAVRCAKNIPLRYIGSGEDVSYNKTQSTIQNESRKIPGLGSIVNVVIRPESVTFNIYEPEVMSVRVRNKEAVAGQRALFEVLWATAT